MIGRAARAAAASREAEMRAARPTAATERPTLPPTPQPLSPPESTLTLPPPSSKVAPPTEPSAGSATPPLLDEPCGTRLMLSLPSWDWWDSLSGWRLPEPRGAWGVGTGGGAARLANKVADALRCKPVGVWTFKSKPCFCRAVSLSSVSTTHGAGMIQP